MELQSLSEDPGLQRPGGNSQNNKGVSEFLEDLREAIYDYNVCSQPFNPS